MDLPDNLRPPGAWWDAGATDTAVTSFLPVLRKLVGEAYRRAGSPYGEAEEALERWLETTKETEVGKALEREIGEAWSFHLQLCFAARQVN